jgi:hypothetical protein
LDQPPGFVFVSWKDTEWHDKAFKSVLEAEQFLSTLDCDIYFSPTTYSEPHRRKEYVQPSRWLWQDLDAVNPDKINPRPTMAWESSPGRYQALWRLDKQYPPTELEIINKKLAEKVNADRGSWILTKVLRVPGSVNLKYPSKPHGKLLWEDGPDVVPTQILKDLPTQVEDVLSKPVTGDRSSILWLIEHELAKAGFNIDEIYDIVKSSRWNKFRGRNDEEKRLMHEIALAMQERPSGNTDRHLKITTHEEVMSAQILSPGWLIKDWWTCNSHGIIAGEPKSWKSTMAMDMAVSVASGCPFLGEYEVHNSGPVIIVQNENADWIVKSRMAAISIHRGIGGNITKAGNTFDITWPRPLPIYYINNQAFTMSNPDHRGMLEALIRKVKPVLVIFDPLYLMFDGDVNSAKDLNPALNWLLWLRNSYTLSIVVVHHWRKSQGQTKRGGQRMLGSTTLHGWVESAWYVQSGDEIEIEREFRGAQDPPKIKLKLSLGEMENNIYSVDSYTPADEVKDLADYVKSHPKQDIREMSAELGIPARRLKRLLEKLTAG